MADPTSPPTRAWPTIETERLTLRPPEPGDVDPLFEIQGDADAMRHTTIAADRDATARFLESYAARYRDDGFAPWTAVLRSEDRIVGWGGLNRDPSEPHWGIEVAYFIDRRHWGQGLASELVRASLRYAFCDLALTHVIAFTRSANEASRRVLTKTGFTFDRHVAELARDRFSIDRDAWEHTG